MKAIILLTPANENIKLVGSGSDFIQLCGVGPTEELAREKAFEHIHRVVNVFKEQYQGGQCVTASQDFINAYNVEPIWDSRLDDEGQVINSISEDSYEFSVGFLKGLFIDENGELNCLQKNVTDDSSFNESLKLKDSPFRHALENQYISSDGKTMVFREFPKQPDSSPYENLDGREWSSLSSEELQQLKDLHVNGPKEGFYICSGPYDIDPVLQLEIYNAPTKEQEFEILRRLQVKIRIVRTPNLTHLAGSK
ncbi:hypothetical protein LI811_002209 [Salmonella enterica]|nr:hypothetical protein [Salmonella enterica]